MSIVAESQFHVLAVDDSIIDRKLIERLLKTSSYQVTTVDSGSKALEFLGFHEDDQSNPHSPSISPNNHQEVEVNLIITDYCMPGMTGYDLLRKIKESSTLKNIPVVIMSSENVPSRITRCLEEGAEEFFLKPVQLSDLKRLRPHMLRTRVRSQKPAQQQEIQEKQQEADKSSEIQSQQQQQQQPQAPVPTMTPPPPPPPPPPTPNNNKRKTMEEGLSPDRTRPRYSGITTMV